MLQFHVAISLLAIASGFIVTGGLVTDRRLNRWTAFCLLTTVSTSVTGFFLPLHGLNPPVIVGIISLIVLAIALCARYAQGMTGAWRGIYLVTLMIALWLNFFVLIAQLFNKVAALKPYENEPPFLAVQALGLLLFVVFTVVALRKFHPNR